MPHVVGDQRGQNAPQPADQLSLACAAKLAEMAMGLQKRLLHQVRRVGLALQPTTDLQSRQQRQIAPVAGQQFAQCGSISGLGQRQQFDRLGGSDRAHERRKILGIARQNDMCEPGPAI